MKTSKKTLFIVPSLLLAAAAAAAAAAAFGAPSASAAPVSQTFAIEFAYDRTDTPAQIYADLRATARKECRNQVGGAPHANWLMRGCIRNVMKAGVDAIARKDVADVYHLRA